MKTIEEYEELTKVSDADRAHCTYDQGVAYSADRKRLLEASPELEGKYTVQSGTEVICDRAFFNSKLEEINIPDSVTNIGNASFLNCKRLKKVSIPNSVTTIGHRAFQNCVSIIETTIPESVTTIGISAFCGCIGLNKVNFNAISCSSAGFENDGYSPIYNKCDKLSEIVFGKSVTIIPNYLFYGCIRIKKITIPNSVTTIGNHAFQNCTGLTELTIVDSVTSIGNMAFADCIGLTKVNFNAVACNSCGLYIFDKCANIKEVRIGDNVAVVPANIFSGCVGMEKVLIGKRVKQIGSYAFEDCVCLQNITSLNPQYPTCHEGAFFSVTPHCTIYVPEESKKAYFNAEGWNKFNNILEL